MTKFRVGDAVRRIDGHQTMAVEWSHAEDGGIAYTVAPRLHPGEIRSADTRDRIKEYDLEFADPALQFFRFGHLPNHLSLVSEPFGRIAHDLVLSLPQNEQRNIALQHLLEAKDAAVRARVFE